MVSWVACAFAPVDYEAVFADPDQLWLFKPAVTTIWPNPAEMQAAEPRFTRMGRHPFAIRVYAPQLHMFLRPNAEDIIGSEVPMNFETFSFRSIRIDGVTHEDDVTIDRGAVRKRKKKPSKRFREEFGHPPVSVAEEIPWDCKRLVIGTGGGAMSVMDQVKHEVGQRRVELSILPTAEAVKELKRHPLATPTRFFT